MIKLGKKVYNGKYRIESDRCIIENDNPFTIGDEGRFNFDGKIIEGFVTKVKSTSRGREFSVIQLF